MGNTKIILDRQQTQILQDIGEISKGTIKIGKDTGERFATKVGTR